MATVENIVMDELPAPLSTHDTPEENTPEVDTSSILPSDHGRAAWLVLAGCVLVQAPVWGYSLAFGIFQEYFTSHNDLRGSAGAIASIGTSQIGIMYLMMPLTFTLLIKYPRLRAWCGPAGLLITTLSLVLSSFATSVGQLIATQGVFYAIGCGLLFSPTSLYLDEWFVVRKGLAYGIMWSGKSAVGVGMPFLMSALLSRYGVQRTLQIWAVASAIMTIPLLVLLKPRVPLSSTSSTAPLSYAFLRYSGFWMLQLGNILQALGYLMPSTYLASYAHSIGLHDVTGPILLAIFSLASVPGSLIHGMLGDRMAAPNVILFSSVGSALAVFLLWGMSQQISVLFSFAIAYGFFAGGFSSTWSGILHEMKRQDSAVDTGLVFGALMGGRGVGFVLSGPIGGELLQVGSLAAKSFSGYATEYGPMIVCSGLTATLGAWGWFWSVGRRMIT